MTAPTSFDLIVDTYRSIMTDLEAGARRELASREYPPELLPYLQNRIRDSLMYLVGSIPGYFRWLFTSREHTNFTYDLSTLNKRHLAWLCHTVTGHPVAQCMQYLRELEQDTALKEHIRKALESSDQRVVSDVEPRYGRRMLWYVLTRLLRPPVVVETGLDKGLGSVVLASAILRNRDEGYEGRYVGIDIDPNAGWMLSDRYLETGEIRIGDSVELLSSIDTPVDLLVLDSSHDAGYETLELRAIEGQLPPAAVIISDTGDYTEDLLNFAEASGREFALFREVPEDHWWPGSGNSIAYGAATRTLRPAKIS